MELLSKPLAYGKQVPHLLPRTFPCCPAEASGWKGKGLGLANSSLSSVVSSYLEQNVFSCLGEIQKKQQESRQNSYI